MSVGTLFDIWVAGINYIGYIGYIKLYNKRIKLTIGSVSYEFDYFKDFTTEIAGIINKYVVDTVITLQNLRSQNDI